MLIIKKSNKIVPFNIEKIYTSIKNTALDLSLTLSRKELSLLTKSVDKKVRALREKDNSPTSFYEVRSIIYETLIENGYKNIALKYNEDIEPHF